MVHDRTVVLEDVREAALRPMGRSGWRFWALAGVLALVVVVGAGAYVYQLIGGLGTAGYYDRGFWGIYEANLVAFIGVSYGGALVSAILRLTQARWRAPITRLAEAMAVFSLLVGAAFAVIHLGRPDRMWELVTRPQASSPIVWDFVAVMTYLVATLVFLSLPLIPDVAVLRDRFSGTAGWRRRLYGALSLNWRGKPGQRRLLEQSVTAVAILIIPIAVLVHSVLSWAFAVNSRPGWDSTIFAPYFVVAALFSGVAMVILVVAGFRKAYHLERYIEPKHFRYLAFLMLTLDLLYLYFTFTELLTEGYTLNEQVTPILTQLLAGQYAPFFWLFVVGAGIVPLLLVALPRTRTVPGIVTASALVVAGMWLKRLLIVVPAVAAPLISGDWGSFRPTWVALSITLAGAAAIPLLLMIFFKFFPILSIYEMEEMAAEPVLEPTMSEPAVPELVTAGVVERGIR
ncbi:MAG TPA: NrfD/PsrC family molybdoenzyme membrane anchor subunit [Thermomicrobiaceae bacterium]|nr:NrfD/PsrC family molybdoenzyme membrane anchor subunit [Thermomicrobiaceae bacterium]